MDKQTKATLAMIMVTIIWGISFVFSSDIVTSGISGSVLMFARFGVGALALLIVAFKNILTSTKAEIFTGTILGLCVSFAMYFQTNSMNYTTISKISFISGLSIIIVPFLAYFINQSKVTKQHIIGLIIAVVGTFIISINPEELTNINRGDLMALIATIGFALQIALLAKYSHGRRPSVISFYQTLTVALAGLIISFISHQEIHLIFNTRYILPLFYVGVIATAFTYIVQATSARYLKEVTISIIISAQAIVAAFLDIIIIGTPLTKQLLIGAILISLSIIYLSIEKQPKVKLGTSNES